MINACSEKEKKTEMKLKSSCISCDRDLDDDGLTLWMDNERRLRPAQLGEPPDHEGQALSPSVPVCTTCNKSYQAIRKIEKAMKRDAQLPVRLAGYLIRALDHHCSDFDDPAEYSRMEVDVYDPGPSYGAWTFGNFPEDDYIQIEHSQPLLFTRSGRFKELATDQTAEVPADLWRLDSVGVVAQFVGAEIAATAAPMLQMPPRDEIAKQWNKLRKELHHRDVGLGERSPDFLDHCWAEGAISIEEHQRYQAKWEAAESLRQ